MLGFILIIPVVIVFMFFGEIIGRLLAGSIVYLLRNIKIILLIAIICFGLYLFIKSQNTKKYYYPNNNNTNSMAYPHNRY
mgnify:CR=1 FL=1